MVQEYPGYYGEFYGAGSQSSGVTSGHSTEKKGGCCVSKIREYQEIATGRLWILPAELAHPRSARSKFRPESSGHPANARSTWSNACASLWLNFSRACGLP